MGREYGRSDVDGWQRCCCCESPIDVNNDEDMESFEETQMCAHCAREENEE